MAGKSHPLLTDHFPMKFREKNHPYHPFTNMFRRFPGHFPTFPDLFRLFPNLLPSLRISDMFPSVSCPHTKSRLNRLWSTEEFHIDRVGSLRRGFRPGDVLESQLTSQRSTMIYWGGVSNPNLTLSI
jgi:hypothetical protein